MMVMVRSALCVVLPPTVVDVVAETDTELVPRGVPPEPVEVELEEPPPQAPSAGETEAAYAESPA